MLFRLSEHIVLSDQHDISVQDLTEKMIKHCGRSQQISTKKLSLESPVLFSNIVKSKVRDNDNTMKISFRMPISDEINSATLTFADIPNNMPNDLLCLPFPKQLLNFCLDTYYQQSVTGKASFCKSPWAVMGLCQQQ